jgi:hypothetical protein
MSTSPPSDYERRKARRDFVTGLAVYSLSLALGVFAALSCLDHGDSWARSVAVGVFVTFLSICLTGFFVFSVYYRFTRRTPFRKGDRVQVTAGPYAGTEGTVCECDSMQLAAQIELDNQSKGAPGNVQWFDWNEIRRISRR